jgi:hypothetical protein
MHTSDMQEQTSIRVSKNLLETLKKFREDSNDSYEDVIWDFVEPHLELTPIPKLKEINSCNGRSL